MSSGENPWNQLLSKKRLRAPGDLTKLRQRLWYGLSVVMTGLDDAMAQDDAEAVQKWIHCLTQVSSVYLRVSIDGDLESRLKQLEATMAQSQETPSSGSYTPAVRRK